MFTIHRGWFVVGLATTLTAVSINPVFAQHEHHDAPTVVGPVDVSGTVVCADGPELPGAVVQVYKTEGAAQPVASALSDKTGRFRVRLPGGRYTVRVSYLGHAAASVPLNIESNSPHSLHPIRLQVNAVELEALVAVADKERLRLRAGATTYDAKTSAAASSSTVAEVLRNIPGLEVDGSGNLTLRGSSSVLIMINGQRTALRGDALTAFLKQMPAAALEKIDIVTTPGAHNDAEGSAGIVNLEFTAAPDELRSNSYAGSLSGATARQFLGSLLHNGSAGTWAWDASYAVSSLRPHTTSETDRENRLSATPSLRSQNSHADARHLLHNAFGGVTWQPSSKQTLGARLGYAWMRGAFDNATSFMDPNAPSLFTRSTLEHTMPNWDASLRWAFHSDSTGHLRVGAEARYADAREDFDGSYMDKDGATFLLTRMNAQRSEWTVKTDGAIDLGRHRLLLGYQGQLRTIDARYLTDRHSNAMVERFSHEQRVHGIYSSVAHALGNAFITAGVRTEVTRTAIALDDEASNNDEWQLFPSLSVHWPHVQSSNSEYQLSYGRRITRPEAAALNPYSMGEDDMNPFIGNPLLQPETVDQLEFGIVRHGAIGSLQVAPYLRYVRDPIRVMKAVTESGRTTTSPHNLNDARSAGIDASAKVRVSDKIAVTLSSNVAYTATRGANLEADGLYASLRGNLDVRLAPGTSLQLFAFRRSAQTIEQGEMHGVWTGDVALRHRFGPDQRGNLTLRVTDPFNTDRLAFHIGDRTFTQRSERKVTSRMLSLSFVWSVGGKAAEHETEKRESSPQIF